MYTVWIYSTYALFLLVSNDEVGRVVFWALMIEHLSSEALCLRRKLRITFQEWEVGIIFDLIFVEDQYLICGLDGHEHARTSTTFVQIPPQDSV